MPAATAAAKVCVKTATPTTERNAPGAWRADARFILEPKGPRHDQKFKDPVLSAYQDRMRRRGIKRPFGVCSRTVVKNGRGKKAAALPAWEDTLPPGEKGDVRERDELGSFVQKKAQALWRWIGLWRRTRQSVAHTIADRREEGARSLRALLPHGCRRGATRRDLWLAGEGVFPRRPPGFGGKEEGETNHAERFVGTIRARLGRLVRRSYSGGDYLAVAFC